VRQKPLPEADLESILTRTTALWDAVRGARLFLTGGTGFFGAWLLESFCHINRRLALNSEIVVLSRRRKDQAGLSSRVFEDPAVQWLNGDIRTFTFPPGAFDCVVHAATDTRASVPAEETFTAVVHGTERVLQFARAAGVKLFLLTSSGAVYGLQPPSISHLPESYGGGPDPIAASSVYGESKRIAEMLCAMYGGHGGLACKIARCWAFCGPRLPLDQHFAIGNFIGDVLDGRPIQIRGDGTARRSYLYAADLAVWLWTVLFRAPALVPFNVGSEEDISIAELAECVARELNPTIEIRIAQKAVEGNLPTRYVPSVTRAKEELGLVQNVVLAETIRRTADWYRS
jgi:nucleoside-diphosphate-sugar epimerase